MDVTKWNLDKKSRLLPLTIMDERGERRVKAQISDFINVKIIIVLLVRKLGFPVYIENVKPLCYYLLHRESKRRLRYYDNLSQAGVKENDTLVLCSVTKEQAVSADFVEVCAVNVTEAPDDVIIIQEDMKHLQETGSETDDLIVIEDK